ncbi:MAG: hypothetical protein P8Z70_00445 [Desulfuromonadales bacterium]|jgi:Zn finger protein HypA/HybF involved in hydrogenase expression
MTVKAGDECRKTGDFRCRKCGELIHVEEGLTIPRCPACNSGEFSLRDRPLKEV